MKFAAIFVATFVAFAAAKPVTQFFRVPGGFYVADDGLPSHSSPFLMSFSNPKSGHVITDSEISAQPSRVFDVASLTTINDNSMLASLEKDVAHIDANEGITASKEKNVAFLGSDNQNVGQNRYLLRVPENQNDGLSAMKMRQAVHIGDELQANHQQEAASIRSYSVVEPAQERIDNLLASNNYAQVSKNGMKAMRENKYSQSGEGQEVRSFSKYVQIGGDVKALGTKPFDNILVNYNGLKAITDTKHSQTGKGQQVHSSNEYIQFGDGTKTVQTAEVVKPESVKAMTENKYLQVGEGLRVHSPTGYIRIADLQTLKDFASRDNTMLLNRDVIKTITENKHSQIGEGHQVHSSNEYVQIGDGVKAFKEIKTAEIAEPTKHSQVEGQQVYSSNELVHVGGDSVKTYEDVSGARVAGDDDVRYVLVGGTIRAIKREGGASKVSNDFAQMGDGLMTSRQHKYAQVGDANVHSSSEFASIGNELVASNEKRMAQIFDDPRYVFVDPVAPLEFPVPTTTQAPTKVAEVEKPAQEDTSYIRGNGLMASRQFKQVQAGEANVHSSSEFASIGDDLVASNEKRVAQIYEEPRYVFIDSVAPLEFPARTTTQAPPKVVETKPVAQEKPHITGILAQGLDGSFFFIPQPTQL